MKRFAKLTRNGAPCYVDPELVGMTFVTDFVRGDGTRATALLQRDGLLLVDFIDEPPDEAYRRLAAAGEVVTAQDVAEAEDELQTALVKSIETLRNARWTTADAWNAKEMARAALEPYQAAIKKLHSTVLRALYVAEGK